MIYSVGHICVLSRKEPGCLCCLLEGEDEKMVMMVHREMERSPTNLFSFPSVSLFFHCLYLFFCLSHINTHIHTHTLNKPINLEMSPNKRLLCAQTIEEISAVHCVYSLLSPSCQGRREVRPGPEPTVFGLFHGRSDMS